MATRLTPKEDLLQMSLRVPEAWEDAVGALLEARFNQCPAAFSEPGSDHSELSLFLQKGQRPSPATLHGLRREIRALGGGAFSKAEPRIQLKTLRRQEWQDAWKQHFKPFEIGRHLLVRPSWSRRRARTGQAVIVLDPGLSFGTGQHPTTRFCLRELTRLRPKNASQSCLDIGTGSGILAIAAAKLGYAPIRGFDLDANAVRIARRNARRNKVDRKVLFDHADVACLPKRRPGGWDVVCANLLADLLIARAGGILDLVRPGGQLVLAGILAKEFDGVDAAYRAHGARLTRARTEAEWRSCSYHLPA